MTTKNINELYACHVKIEGRHSFTVWWAHI